MPNKTTLILLTLAGLGGCSSLGTRPAPQRLAVQTPASMPEDEAISRNVRSQLHRDVPLAEIDVRTAQGKVELSGNVEDSDVARRAVKGALAVEGVRGVVNDLNVTPEEDGRAAALRAAAL